MWVSLLCYDMLYSYTFQDEYYMIYMPRIRGEAEDVCVSLLALMMSVNNNVIRM